MSPSAPQQHAHETLAVAPRGTERLLADELRELGLTARTGRGIVTISGGLDAAYRVCLWSRVAARVLLPVARFNAGDREALYAGASSVDWDRHVRPDGTLAILASGTTPGLVDTRFSARVVKDALVDQIRERHGRRPSVDLRSPDLRLSLHLERGEGTLSIDLSGDGLHRRGYREAGRQTEAPLKENLAAAALRAAGWPALARRGAALVDPLCGSGTFVIEAAGMAADAAPGLTRSSWGFLRWPGHDGDLWDRLLREAEERRIAGLARLAASHSKDAVFLGFDKDARSVELAREALRRAGMQTAARIRQCALEDLRLPTGWRRRHPGLFIVNPPYGERLDDAGLASLYSLLGRVLRRDFAGWRAAVLLADERLGRKIGMPRPRRFPLYNGPLRCTLLTATVPEGGHRTAERAAPARPLAQTAQTEAAERTAPKAQPAVHAAAEEAAEAPPATGSPSSVLTGARVTGRDLERLFAGESVPPPPPAHDAPATGDLTRPESGAAGRVFSRRTPRQPEDGSAAQGVTATEFANRLRRNLRTIGRPLRRAGISCYRLYDADLPDFNLALDLYDGWAVMQEYAAPAQIDPAKARARLSAALEAVRETLDLPAERIVVKVRRRQRGADQYGRLGRAAHVITVRERDEAFLVNLSDYVDTGLFLDQRLTRGLLRELAPGLAFLNLFGYTGAATISAARGGAARSLTVDLSATYLDWARRNFALNSLDPRHHRLLRADCIRWLREERHRRFGLVYLAPPAFSNSRRMGRDTLDVQRDHVVLIRGAARLLETGGTLIFDCSLRRFRLDRASLADYELTDLSRCTLPPDFVRSAASHHVWAVRPRDKGHLPAREMGRHSGPLVPQQDAAADRRQTPGLRVGDRRAT